MNGRAARAAIVRAIYAQVDAPGWAATNLDALTDVLRDLSWLPEGAVRIVLPDLSGLTDDERHAMLDVLTRAVRESSGDVRPVQVRASDDRD